MALIFAESIPVVISCLLYTSLAEVEEAQMKVIEKYLPAQLSPEELEAEMKKIIAEAGAETMKDLGKVMGIASKAFAGKSDGKSISEMAKILLS